MVKYFPEPKSLGKGKAELDLSNYATKTDFKNATGIGTWSVAENVDLASLKSDADKLDIDILQIVPTNLILISVDLRKLIDVVRNNVVKKDTYNASIP